MVETLDHDAGDVQSDDFFSPGDIAGVYKAIFNRRDVRGEFTAEDVPEAVLSRVLYAAHHAPSVGFMQPWNFIIIRSEEVKQSIHSAFSEANEEAKAMFDGEKKALYSSLKLQGILDSRINICVTCDRERIKGPVLGRTHIKTMDLFSSVCAVQNLWLAARAEDLGVGWVSIVKQEALQEALNIPSHIVPIAYLCVGYTSQFKKQPELQTRGWRERLPLEELIYIDQWQQKPETDDPLLQQIKENKDFPVKSLL